jgi:phosphocarrier protein
VFVSTATKFKSELTLLKGEKRVNAKSIMGVLSMGITKGTVITISAEGPDEEEAAGALLELIKSNFNE